MAAFFSFWWSLAIGACIFIQGVLDPVRVSFWFGAPCMVRVRTMHPCMSVQGPTPPMTQAWALSGEVLLDRAWSKSARWPRIIAIFDTLAGPLFHYFPLQLVKVPE